MSELTGKTPMEFASVWYDESDIARSIAARHRVGPRPIQQVPENIDSPEFAKWLTDQYRLAMAKGIDLARSEARESLTTCQEQLAAVTAERDSLKLECERLGRCNEHISRTDAQVINRLQATIRRLMLHNCPPGYHPYPDDGERLAEGWLRGECNATDTGHDEPGEELQIPIGGGRVLWLNRGENDYHAQDSDGYEYPPVSTRGDLRRLLVAVSKGDSTP